MSPYTSVTCARCGEGFHGPRPAGGYGVAPSGLGGIGIVAPLAAGVLGVVVGSLLDD